MSIEGRKITLHEMSLRDGMHAKRHQISTEQMIEIAKAADEAGMPWIEVTHGDGLGGASVNYGFPASTDVEYLSAVIPHMKKAKVSALLLPGIGTVDTLKEAMDAGISGVRVATHCTEADCAEQHITYAAKTGLDTVGFLMMAHRASPEKLVEQALLMEGYGANCVYCTDSAGHMLPRDVTDRVAAIRAALRPETELGFHGHHNLGMGIANSVAAVEAGANRIDGAIAGLGAGAGNAATELLVAVFERMGAETGVDLFKIMDAAEDIVVPMMDRPIRVDRGSLVLGYAGVYSSFLLFAERAEKRYGIPARDLLLELGRRGMVGGQEDMIEDLALTMSRAKA
ncbi:MULTISPECIES: 4-hydroxy-2-oxovalerate aldolase [Alphaproteobacteria]|uniref:4-hydroxy-2-oxovalerate aldolase n=2 Tax=Alphaproteobacteria TaxID=28211 RepID=A0A512HNI3_9HYPH|nr:MULTISPECIES: 4-hydroxy-2-oxovalerate aldolase [Alphaproteobacteria]GEO87018.1 4-hydroxy-2-oxovalerate aldolase [Ciceribacter naphthalenivorans]GLR21606.1 4-hydroxy-2-oxovalerate aldolase [Ciceribacter naphthalenivorans]GLT04462.1 4-hydroxy-2-oxovalerate aldolase [Sphingomonas psychrolutea]